MSLSAKFIVKVKNSSDDSEHPIHLQIIINRKNQLVSTKKHTSLKDWDSKTQTVKKGHPQAQTINALLISIRSEIDYFILSAGRQNQAISFDDLKAIVRRLTGVQEKKPVQKLLGYFQQQVEGLKEKGRLGYAETFIHTHNSLKAFLNGKDIDLASINLEFIRRYEEYLVKRNCAVTTRSVYLRTFRTLWRNAMKDGVCAETHYPFKDFEFGKYNNPRTKKRAISKEQIDLLASINIDPEKDTYINSRNYFLFSFFCRGINFTDLASLKWENVRNNVLQYTRAKTKEEFIFSLHPKAVEIIEYYRNMEGNSDAGYIFPILYKRHKTLQSIRDRKKKVLARVNKNLKELAQQVGIEKDLTTYAARHSYATILRRKGFSNEDIGRSLGHDSIKTTKIYLEDIGDPLFDNAINESL